MSKILLAMSLVPALFAQPYVWKNVEIVGGGFIPGLRLPPRPAAT